MDSLYRRTGRRSRTPRANFFDYTDHSAGRSEWDRLVRAG